MARSDRVAPKAEDARFLNGYPVTGNRSTDSYIFQESVPGKTTRAENSPVVVSNKDLFVTVPHEILHKYPHSLNDVGNHENNIMNFKHRIGTTPQKPLRLYKLQPVHTGSGQPNNRRQKESQWLEINNRNKQR